MASNSHRNGTDPLDGLAHRDPSALREHVVSACREQGTWREIDGWLVEQFVEMVRMIGLAQEQYCAEGLTVKGARGNETPHPAIGIASQARQAAARCLDRLILTPESRRKARIPDPGPANDPLARMLAGLDEFDGD